MMLNIAKNRDARLRMISEQLLPRGIRDTRLLAAMSEIPREIFVPTLHEDHAYQDYPLPIGFGQTISQPYMVAIMAELLHLRGHETVLEIGAGSGYNAAILAHLAKRVIAIERIQPLLEQAQAHWTALNLTNIEGHLGDGSLGWPEAAPYDAISVTAGAPEIPQPLLEQLLAESGCMVIPVGQHRLQTLCQVWCSASGQPVIRKHLNCVFVPLVGEAGWTE